MSVLERFRRATGARPLVYGHRGASAHAPENSLKAFARAVEDGADGVELDVRFAAGKEIVVFHDPELHRTGGTSGRIRTTPYHVLRSLDIGEGERIALLDDALDLILSRDRIVNIEAKSDDVDKLAMAQALAKLVARRAEKERAQIMFSTFHPQLLLMIRALVRPIPCAFLFEEDLLGRVLGRTAPIFLSPDLIHPHRDLVTEHRMKRWREHRVIVNTWTVDEPEDLQRFQSLGIDGVITNDPKRALAAFGG